MNRRRIALLAFIGLVPMLVALSVAGYDASQQLGLNVFAYGTVATDSASESAPDNSPGLYVVALVDPASISAVRPGHRADVRIPALGAEYVGTVRDVQSSPSGSPEPTATGPRSAASLASPGVPVRIDFDYGSAPLKAGMSASIRIHR